MSSEPTDSELVERMARGDRDALAAIFRRHQRTVYRFSRQMLGSHEAAEDVTQDVFVALSAGADRFNPAAASLSTYLYGIARNCVRQRYKRSRARIEVNIDEMAARDEASLARSADPAEALAHGQMVRQLRLAILRLPLHYREVVVLCELNGLSYEDAASVAACPVGTVRSRLNRARKMLVERCRAILRTGPGDDREGQTTPAPGERRWLIVTKNGC